MGPDTVENLFVRGEPVGLVLRVDTLPIERHVEHSAVTALETSGDSELFLDGGLQTGGLWVVISFGAIGDLDVHAFSPFPARRAKTNHSRGRRVARVNGPHGPQAVTGKAGSC